jgi:hypothetical protein
MNTGLRVLYVGPLWKGSTALHRMVAIRELGHDVTPFDTSSKTEGRARPNVFVRVVRRLGRATFEANLNRRLVEAVMAAPFEVLWIDKGLFLSPTTLRIVKATQPKCLVVGYSPDDMINPANQTAAFLQALSLYDLYFTTKSFGVSELRSLGCHNVHFVGNGFDPAIHAPLAVTSQSRLTLGGPVGFIGAWEIERAKSVEFLARNGVEVRVWGDGWNGRANNMPHLRVESRALWEHDYARALCAFDINLCFLRKANRDLQTTRSVEIPACGSFMLAERTSEHTALFDEDKEAAFFSSDSELLEKVNYYLSHPQERLAVAQAGRERCLTSGYSNTDRMRAMLEVVAKARRGR